MAYKLLGFVVWKGAKLYAHRRFGAMVPSRKVASAGLVAIAVGALAVAASRRDSAAE